LQDVFCRLAARPTLLAGVRSERAFLLRLAHNQAIDLMRRRSTREKTGAAAAGDDRTGHPFAASAQADEDGFRRALSAALAELPPEQRAVAHLKLWENATFGEIAATLDISPNTAASRYRYALDKLRARLRPLYHEIKHLWTTSSNS
jgi:RNA polymerase sigma-70 factor (ECF subfamily)